MGACSGGGYFQWHSFFGFQRNPPLPGLEEKERMGAIGAPPVCGWLGRLKKNPRNSGQAGLMV